MYFKLAKMGFPHWVLITISRTIGFFRYQLIHVYLPHGFKLSGQVTLLGFTAYLEPINNEATGNNRGLYVWFFNWHLGFIAVK